MRIKRVLFSTTEAPKHLSISLLPNKLIKLTNNLKRNIKKKYIETCTWHSPSLFNKCVKYTVRLVPTTDRDLDDLDHVALIPLSLSVHLFSVPNNYMLK